MSSSPTFITRDETIRRLSAEHVNEMNACVEKVNRCIRESKAMPIVIGEDCFPTTPVVLAEAIRRLEQECKWRVTKNGNKYELDDRKAQ